MLQHYVVCSVHTLLSSQYVFRDDIKNSDMNCVSNVFIRLDTANIMCKSSNRVSILIPAIIPIHIMLFRIKLRKQPEKIQIKFCL